MKFNLEKWQRLQDKKAALHQVYLAASEEFDHANQAFSRSRSFFVSNYRGDIVAHVAVAQDYKLSPSEIDAKLRMLREDWAKACEKFNVSEGWLGRNALITLYAEMRELARWRENKEQAARNQTAFGACFNVLDDFASKYGANDKSRISAVADTGGYY
ncbi:hypothetical protein [Methylomonas sp. MgM2]